MVKRGTRQHQSVYERHRQACPQAIANLTQHSTRSRAVQVQLVLFPAVESGNHKRLAVHLESHVGQKRRIQDRVNGLWIMRATFWQSAELRSRCQSHCFSRANVAIQFASHVLPPSAENACSSRKEAGVMSEKMKRT